jgi:hypothetical protein
MSVIKDVVNLFESSARIKILAVLWISALILYIVPPDLKLWPLLLISIWGIVEIASWLINRKKNPQVHIYIPDNGRDGSTREEDDKRRKSKFSSSRNTSQVFNELSPQSIGIVKFWSQHGNRWKIQRLNFNNEDVQALYRAGVIEEDNDAYDLDDEQTDYKISNWAADYLGKHPL